VTGVVLFKCLIIITLARGIVAMDIFSLQKINLQNISSLSGNFVYGHHGQVLFLIDRNLFSPEA
jgi:hypothetical protein